MNMTKVIAWVKSSWNQYGIAYCAALFILLPGIAWLIGWSVGNAILWATGLVLLAYTAETQGMRLEILRQNEITIQPLLILGIEAQAYGTDSKSRGKAQIVLRNIGRGPALYIRLRDIEFLPDQGMGRALARFETVDCLEAGKDTAVKTLAVLQGAGGEGELGDFIASLNPQYARETYHVTITYEDVGREEWESLMRLGKGGIRLLRHKKAGPPTWETS